MNGQSFHSFQDLGRSMGIKDQPALSNQASNSHHSAEHEEMPEFLKESADYVAIAEQKILSLGQPDRRLSGKRYFGRLTTSKVRNILSLINRPYNRIVLLRGELPEDIVNDIRYLKVRLVYEAGREPAVMEFCQKAELIDAIDFIKNSKPLFLRYAKYMEALVAYHKFYNSRND